VEADGRRAATVSVLDRDKVSALGIEVLDLYALGLDELLEAGLPRLQIDAEISLRAARELGVTRAVVPPEFPLFVADHLRTAGLELAVDEDLFVLRRRAKTEHELDGIRRAQKAADACMRTGAGLIRELRAGLTAEEVRAAMQAVAEEHGCDLPDDVIVGAGAQGAAGHEAGHGEIPAGAPVIVDIWPRDRESRCWADMTRTFVVGEVSGEVRALEELVRTALERSREAVRPGVTGIELHALACEVFEEAGYRTQRTGPGDDPDAGFQFSLGHGVGLSVHEDPPLGLAGHSPLVVGDVIALEPGLWVPGLGEVRLEDLLLVTDGGSETLTDYPYDLTP
jgi:Xaa-Pro aminopeptidase